MTGNSFPIKPQNQSQEISECLDFMHFLAFGTIGIPTLSEGFLQDEADIVSSREILDKKEIIICLSHYVHLIDSKAPPNSFWHLLFPIIGVAEKVGFFSFCFNSILSDSNIDADSHELEAIVKNFNPDFLQSSSSHLEGLHRGSFSHLLGDAFQKYKAIREPNDISSRPDIVSDSKPSSSETKAYFGWIKRVFNIPTVPTVSKLALMLLSALGTTAPNVIMVFILFTAPFFIYRDAPRARFQSVSPTRPEISHLTFPKEELSDLFVEPTRRPVEPKLPAPSGLQITP